METTATAGYTCPTCAKEFKNALGLSGHSKSHKKAEAKIPVEQPNPSLAPIAQPGTIVTTSTTPTSAQVAPIRELTIAPKFQYSIEKWRELQPPIVEHLKLTYGNWLNHFEIGQQWREDFGGYAMYIRVPEQFSTEWKRLSTPVYDNKTRTLVDNKMVTIEDIRWCSLKNLPHAIKWLDKVKRYIIDNAYRKGIRLANTNTGLEKVEETYQDYNRAIAGVQAAPQR